MVNTIFYKHLKTTTVNITDSDRIVFEVGKTKDNYIVIVDDCGPWYFDTDNAVVDFINETVEMARKKNRAWRYITERNSEDVFD